MTTKKSETAAPAPAETTKEALAIQKADGNFDRAKFVKDIGDGVVRLVNEQRARKGLPPLKP